MEQLRSLWQSTGLYQLTLPQAVMVLVCLLLLYLAIRKKFEPLLLLPIAFGGLLAEYSGRRDRLRRWHPCGSSMRLVWQHRYFPC